MPAIIWKSRTQRTVAKSTMEAEYMALSDAVSEVDFVVAIRKELGLDIPLPVVVYGDNQAALRVGEADCGTKKSRHINVRYHNVKEHVTNRIVELKYVSTDE